MTDLKCPHCGGTHKPWVMCEEVDPETFYGPKFPATGNMADAIVYLCSGPVE
jgi:hypothetical protein